MPCEYRAILGTNHLVKAWNFHKSACDRMPEHARCLKGLWLLQCVLEFPLACGISVGTPVCIRGVPVGSVLNVNPSLEKVEVLVDVSGLLSLLSLGDASPFQ